MEVGIPTFVSKREENRLRTENKILKVSVNLFIEKGVDATTIEDIVINSSIARGTFYNYFKSPEEIWKKLISDLFLKNTDRIRQEQKGSESIYELIYRGYFAGLSILNTAPFPALIAKNQVRFRDSLYNHEFVADIFKGFQIQIKKGGRLSTFPKNFIKMTSYSMVGILVELLIQSHLNDDHFTIEEMAEYLTTVFEKGIFGGSQLI